MLQTPAVPSQKLGTRLEMIVTGFLPVALGLSLLVSWDLRVLAARAGIEGPDLEAAASPLVQ
jgi:hypothetical protein